MRQYRIWNAIRTVGGRESSVDYGANVADNRRILVGTGSRNSHAFAEVVTECYERGDDLHFSLWIDGECIKRAVLRKGASELESQRP